MVVRDARVMSLFIKHLSCKWLCWGVEQITKYGGELVIFAVRCVGRTSVQQNVHRHFFENSEKGVFRSAVVFFNKEDLEFNRSMWT